MEANKRELSSLKGVIRGEAYTRHRGGRGTRRSRLRRASPVLAVTRVVGGSDDAREPCLLCAKPLPRRLHLTLTAVLCGGPISVALQVGKLRHRLVTWPKPYTCEVRRPGLHQGLHDLRTPTFNSRQTLFPPSESCGRGTPEAAGTGKAPGGVGQWEVVREGSLEERCPRRGHSMCLRRGQGQAECGGAGLRPSLPRTVTDPGLWPQGAPEGFQAEGWGGAVR